MELDEWGSMPQHVLCPWQLQGIRNAKWSSFRWEDRHPTQQKHLPHHHYHRYLHRIKWSVQAASTFTRPPEKSLQNQKRIYANLFFLRGSDNPNKGILDFKWLICPHTQYEIAFMISNRSLIFSWRLISLHHSCEMMWMESMGPELLVHEEASNDPRFFGRNFWSFLGPWSLLPPKAIEMAGKMFQTSPPSGSQLLKWNQPKFKQSDWLSKYLRLYCFWMAGAHALVSGDLETLHVQDPSGVSLWSFCVDVSVWASSETHSFHHEQHGKHDKSSPTCKTHQKMPVFFWGEQNFPSPRHVNQLTLQRPPCLKTAECLSASFEQQRRNTPWGGPRRISDY